MRAKSPDPHMLRPSRQFLTVVAQVMLWIEVCGCFLLTALCGLAIIAGAFGDNYGGNYIYYDPSAKHTNTMAGVTYQVVNVEWQTSIGKTVPEHEFAIITISAMNTSSAHHVASTFGAVYVDSDGNFTTPSVNGMAAAASSNYKNVEMKCKKLAPRAISVTTLVSDVPRNVNGSNIALHSDVESSPAIVIAVPFE